MTYMTDITMDTDIMRQVTDILTDITAVTNTSEIY